MPPRTLFFSSSSSLCRWKGVFFFCVSHNCHAIRSHPRLRMMQAAVPGPAGSPVLQIVSDAASGTKRCPGSTQPEFWGTQLPHRCAGAASTRHASLRTHVWVRTPVHGCVQASARGVRALPVASHSFEEAIACSTCRWAVLRAPAATGSADAASHLNRKALHLAGVGVLRSCTSYHTGCCCRKAGWLPKRQCSTVHLQMARSCFKKRQSTFHRLMAPYKAVGAYAKARWQAAQNTLTNCVQIWLRARALR